jgi:uncharacterized membrane protein YfhO
MVLCIIGCVFFYKTIFFGLLPVPSDSLVGLYHPWRDFYVSTYPQGIPFKNFLVTDPVRQQIPWRHTVIEELKHGLMPLWSPYSFSGAPLAANIQSGAWSPFNLLFFLFDFPVAWTIIIISQPLLSMIFMFLYIRRLKNPILSSLFGSVIWGFSGFSIAWMTWGTIGHVALWLPVLLLLSDRISEEKNVRRQIAFIIMFVLVNAVQLSAGHAQTSLYVLGLAFVYGIWRIRKGLKHPIIGFTVSWIVSFVVTSPIWKPMLDLINDSNRITGTYWLKEGWFFPWQHLAQFVAPDFFGNPTTMNYWGVWNYGEMIGYIGLLGIIFAVGLFFVRHTRDELFWIFVLGIAFLFMTPNPIGELVFRLRIPVFSSLQPTRLLVVVDFALSMLAVYEFSRIEKGDRKPLVRGVLVIGCCISLLWVWSLMTGTIVSIRNLYLPTGLFVLIVCFAGVLIRFKDNRKLVRMALISLFLITSVDLFRFGWKFTPFTPTSLFFPETKTISFLKAQQDPFRVLSVDERIFAANTLEYYGIESVSGYDPLFEKRYAEFIASQEQKKVVTDISFERIIAPNLISEAFLSLLNVRYVISIDPIEDERLSLVFEEGQTKVYENTAFLPRVYFAKDVVNVSLDEAALSHISNPSFSPKTESVVLHGGVRKQDTVSDLESIRLIEYAYGNMIIGIDTMQERLLVVSNPYYPGWKVYIDGTETQILQVNYLFMGILVPKGQHSIQVTYK